MRTWDAGHLSDSIVTLSFFKYEGWQKLWGMKQMGVAPKQIKQLPGIRFFKLLGSGSGNGFSHIPDFSTYGLLCVWNNIWSAQNFFERTEVFEQFKKHSKEQWTVYMQTITSHGQWSGEEPFKTGNKGDENSVIGVITRASIQPKHIWSFWRSVPKVSDAIYNHPGLIFSKGIGEVPLLEQATFSLWKTKKEMVDYAYRNPQHKEVIRKTREYGWFKEELFAQFKPFYSDGTWEGKDPLQKLLIKDYEQILHQSLK